MIPTQASIFIYFEFFYSDMSLSLSLAQVVQHLAAVKNSQIGAYKNRIHVSNSETFGRGESSAWG